MDLVKKAKGTYHFLLAYVGAVVYGYPSRELFVIGVTGTKGKSTVLEILAAGLEAAGNKVALSSSVRTKIGAHSKTNQSGNTMPGRLFLQNFMRRAVKADCQFALIEVTSEGVRQHRDRFIDFDVAAFTNLHPEHIESHGSLEKYREAKLDFFRNVDKFSNKHPKWFFVNGENDNSKFFIEVANNQAISSFKKDIEGYELSPALIGDFNRENVAIAEAILKTVGVTELVRRRTFKTFLGVPGRVEFVKHEPFAVVVDYAHTPESLRTIYSTLKKELKPNNLICVLGSAGGGRDKWKRPEMGKIAAHYCDTIILTDEDPYDEDPEGILNEVEAGIREVPYPRPEVFRILDRREAVRKAIGLARPGDVVIGTGKGSEDWIHLARGKKIPWNEKRAFEDALIQKK